jgi:hypothetical protein
MIRRPTTERVTPESWALRVTYWQSLAAYRWASQLATGASVLDIGCGEGYGTAELARTARLVIGLDVDLPTLEHARRRYPAANLTWVRASAERLPFRAASFQLICCFQVLEHLPDPERFLREARRVLVPGGHLILTTPNRPAVFSGLNPHHAGNTTKRACEHWSPASFRESTSWGCSRARGSSPTAQPIADSSSAFFASIGSGCTGIYRPNSARSCTQSVRSPSAIGSTSASANSSPPSASTTSASQQVIWHKRSISSRSHVTRGTSDRSAISTFLLTNGHFRTDNETERFARRRTVGRREQQSGRGSVMVLTRMVGARVRRKEDPRLITGSSQYVDDLQLGGMLYAAFVRSAYPHAIIKRIDPSPALALPAWSR